MSGEASEPGTPQQLPPGRYEELLCACLTAELLLDMRVLAVLDAVLYFEVGDIIAPARWCAARAHRGLK